MVPIFPRRQMRVMGLGDEFILSRAREKKKCYSKQKSKLFQNLYEGSDHISYQESTLHSQPSQVGYFGISSTPIYLQHFLACFWKKEWKKETALSSCSQSVKDHIDPSGHIKPTNQIYSYILTGLNSSYSIEVTQCIWLEASAYIYISFFSHTSDSAHNHSHISNGIFDLSKLRTSPSN